MSRLGDMKRKAIYLTRFHTHMIMSRFYSQVGGVERRNRLNIHTRFDEIQTRWMLDSSSDILYTRAFRRSSYENVHSH